MAEPVPEWAQHVLDDAERHAQAMGTLPRPLVEALLRLWQPAYNHKGGNHDVA